MIGGINRRAGPRRRSAPRPRPEASAIGAIARLHNVPKMIVMKGVMDHGDHTKADNFKAFAARESAPIKSEACRSLAPS